LKIFDFNRLSETLGAYVETRIELLKLDMKEELGKGIAKTLTWAFVLLCVLAAIFFGSFGLSVWINQLLESSYTGFLLVGAFYTILALTTYTLRAKIEHRFLSKFKEVEEIDSPDENEQ
jgi:nitrate reductase NapE component|tara:strand:- start:81704 stop:82060 length:357 start_codon:yes stop_codon:yes gene_type:complete